MKYSSSDQPKLSGVTISSTNKSGTAKVQTSVKPGLILWDAESQSYFVSPTLKSCDPFSLELTKISHGSHAGLEALVVVPVCRKHFQFLNLPPEVRNMIYTAVFCDENLEIRADKPQTRNAPSSIWIKSEKKLELALFLVCKQLSLEGGSILYGANTFVSGNMMLLGTFLQSIGHNKQYVKSIRIGWVALPNQNHKVMEAMRAVQKLSVMSNLSHVYIEWTAVSSLCGRTAGATFADLFAPVFISIYRRNKSHEDVLAVFGIPKEEPCCNEMTRPGTKHTPQCLASSMVNGVVDESRRKFFVDARQVINDILKDG